MLQPYTEADVLAKDDSKDLIQNKILLDTLDWVGHMLEESDDVQSYIRDHPTSPDSYFRTLTTESEPAKEDKSSAQVVESDSLVN